MDGWMNGWISKTIVKKKLTMCVYVYISSFMSECMEVSMNA